MALLDSLLYFLVKTLNYAFCFVAMTFNVWAIVSMCVGLAVTEFCFSVYSDRQKIAHLVEDEELMFNKSRMKSNKKKISINIANHSDNSFD